MYKKIKSNVARQYIVANSSSVPRRTHTPNSRRNVINFIHTEINLINSSYMHGDSLWTITLELCRTLPRYSPMAAVGVHLYIVLLCVRISLSLSYVFGQSFAENDDETFQRVCVLFNFHRTKPQKQK